MIWGGVWPRGSHPSLRAFGVASLIRVDQPQTAQIDADA